MRTCKEEIISKVSMESSNLEKHFGKTKLSTFHAVEINLIQLQMTISLSLKCSPF